MLGACGAARALAYPHKVRQVRAPNLLDNSAKTSYHYL